MQIRAMRTKDQKGNPIEIGVEVQERAIVAWSMRPEPLGHQALGYDIDRVFDIEWKGDWPFARQADAIIQKMRKAGLLRLDRGRGWHVTDTGREFVRSIADRLE